MQLNKENTNGRNSEHSNIDYHKHGRLNSTPEIPKLWHAYHWWYLREMSHDSTESKSNSYFIYVFSSIANLIINYIFCINYYLLLYLFVIIVILNPRKYANKS